MILFVEKITNNQSATVVILC